ncbi:MAG TPA: trypsin-like peptidase domain-containing protein [Steroidobacteraceae bacterium]|nr:trypsin-like peptidase domain-containing protein [Steroidobacteraceae bacterium]
MKRPSLGAPLRALAVTFLLTVGPAALAAQAPAANGQPSGTAAEVPADVENAVVKVFATARYPSPFRPWTKETPSELTASGVIIDGNRILTNAHAVIYASDIQVQASKEGDKVPATVAAIAPGIDLAVLRLADDSFFRKHAPVARANMLPRIKDSVLVYGFPVGGDSLSITKGIVSRIEFVPYSFSASGLRIQIDAAINPGNSGGPAIAGDRMIGIAFSRLGGDTQNIGYIIPNEEIELFLRGIAHGHYEGKPAMYDELQTLENPALRRYLKLDAAVTGIVVNQPYHHDPDYPLKEWDVISRIGDTPIDDQGMITVDSDVRLSFRYLIQKVTQDGKVPLTIVRAGKTLRIELPVTNMRPMLIPDLQGEYPPYFIYGPIVFSKATTAFLAPISTNANAQASLSFIGSPLLTRRGDPPDADRKELVVISSPFFPNMLAEGYSNHAGSVVASINGKRVHSLANLVALLRDLQDEFVVIGLEGRGGETLVFPRKEMISATDGILTDNGVRAQGSPEMLAVWQHKADAK